MSKIPHMKGSPVKNSTAKISKQQGRFLLLGDTHVRTLDEKKMLSKSFNAYGIDGLKRNQIISQHKHTIKSEVANSGEVIIHIGCNGSSKGIPQQQIINDLGSTDKRNKEFNPNI